LGPAHERVQVRWEWKQEAIECRGDSQRLVQVFWNLLLNAYQAMPEGGILTLWGEMGEGWASVKIQDNGPGILEAELPRLFEPFYTTKRGGSGLGLPISRKILEAHGGKIDVKSLSPYGTLFTLQIPTRT
jgi:signal transduction histidine kinase